MPYSKNKQFILFGVYRYTNELSKNEKGLILTRIKPLKK
jgi:hypothetical protein